MLPRPRVAPESLVWVNVEPCCTRPDIRAANPRLQCEDRSQVPVSPSRILRNGWRSPTGTKVSQSAGSVT